MSKGKRIQKGLTYKKAHFHTPPGLSLKAMLEHAILARATVGERKSNVGDFGNPAFHLMGSTVIDPGDGFIFGVLMAYTPGTDPMFLVDDDMKTDVLLEKIKAPETPDGKRREFLESLMHFGVFGDHLVLMQSQALRSQQLEAYIQWLLREAAILAVDNTLELIDTPPKSAQEKMEQGSGVRSITLGGEVLKQTAPAASHGSADGSQTHVVPVNNGILRAMLDSLFAQCSSSIVDLEKLSGSNIEMHLTLRYRTKTTLDGQRLMDTMGRVLRHADGVETALELSEGFIIKGDELKIKGPISVTSYDGQLDSAEVNEGMRQWLISKVSSQELS